MVRWARDPWRLKDRMDRLRGSQGNWLESERDKVEWLVRNLFGGETAQVSVVVGGGEE